MVPHFDLPLEIENIGEDLTKQLEVIIDSEENNIRESFSPFRNKYDGNRNPDEVNGLEDWVTNRAFEYNLLNYSDIYPELKTLKSKIYQQYLNYISALGIPNDTVPYIQVWFNVLRKDSRFFTRHHHAHPARIGDVVDAYISGNICIRAEDTKTYYYSPYIDNQSVGVKNVPGECVLFPSWAYHSTDQNKAELPRLSVAFDIITQEMYDKNKMDNRDNYIRLDQ
jgi:hypothetical protein